MGPASARWRALGAALALLALCGVRAALPGSAAAAPPPQPAQVGAIAQDPALGRIFIAQPASNVVFVLSGTAMRPVAILRVPATPSALAVDAQRHRLYVASDQDGMISVFDDRSGDLLRIYPVDGDPVGLALADRGNTLLVTDGVSGSVGRLALHSTSKPVALFSIGSAATPAIVFAPQAAAAGHDTLAWARGFAAGEQVQVNWGTQWLMTVRANPAGIVTAGFRVPRGVGLGPHLVVLQSKTTTESGLLDVVRAPIVKHTRTVRHAGSSTSLLQRLLAPTVTLPLPAPQAHRRGATQAGIRVPVVLLAPAPVLLLLAFALLRRRRKKKGAAKPQKGKGRKRAARGASVDVAA